MDCSVLGSSASGIFQARILEWDAISYSRESSPSRDRIYIFCISSISRRISLLTAPIGKPLSIRFSVNDLTCAVLFIWPHKEQVPRKSAIYILFHGSTGNQVLDDLSSQFSLQTISLLNFSSHTLELLKAVMIHA